MEYLPRASLCTYVARSIPHVCTGVRVALLIVTTTCDFKRGGATKPIIGSSWNNAVKTAWTCIRYRNVLVWLCWLFFVDYDVCKRLCNPAWSIFQYFFCRHTHTHTHTDTKALLYPCCACARGVTRLDVRCMSARRPQQDAVVVWHANFTWCIWTTAVSYLYFKSGT